MTEPPSKSNKGLIRRLAIGFTGGVAAMQTDFAQKTLDTTYYGIHVDLYIPLNIIVFLVAMGLNIVVGGSLITNIKGKPHE